MLSLFSTLGGLLISGLPKLLEYFHTKSEQQHELALARVQADKELQMLAQGFAAQQKIEELRTDQISMQTDAQMTVAAYDHDKAVLAKAASWVSSYVATVRPTVTYIFIVELCAINAWLAYFVYSHPGLIVTIDDLVRVADIIFSSDEMAMLGAIVGYWFGSRGWNKK